MSISDTATETRWTKVRILDDDLPLYDSEAGDQVLAHLTGHPVIEIGPSAGKRLRAVLADGTQGFVSEECTVFRFQLGTLAGSKSPIFAEPSGLSKVLAEPPKGGLVEFLGPPVRIDGAWLPVRLSSGIEGWLPGDCKVIMHGACVRIQPADGGPDRLCYLKDNTLRPVSELTKRAAEASARSSARMFGLAGAVIAALVTGLPLFAASGPVIDKAVVVGFRAAQGYLVGWLLGRAVAFFNK